MSGTRYQAFIDIQEALTDLLELNLGILEAVTRGRQLSPDDQELVDTHRRETLRIIERSRKELEMFQRRSLGTGTPMRRPRRR